MNNPSAIEDTLFSRLPGNKNIWIFSLLWLLTFIIYIPTAKAGWVIDAIGWVYNANHQAFWEYLNQVHSGAESFYQLYALHFLVFYKLWGLNVWMWSLLYITMHAVNAFLAFIICRNIFLDSGLKNSVFVPLCGVILFTVSPYISEVLVWKACFHYLQGFLFILLIMLCVQKYQHTGQSRYIWSSALVFLLSCFALEIFYLTPFFVLSIAVYYRMVLGYDKKIFLKTVLYFFLLQLLLLSLYFIGLYARYRFFSPHVNNAFSQSVGDYLSKPPKYLFHMLFLGRFFSPQVKDKVYAICGSAATLLLFYSLCIAVFLYFVTRLKHLTTPNKALGLLLVWTVMPIAFLMPLSFPESSLLVFYDRYTYFASGFIYIVITFLLSRILDKKLVVLALWAYACAQLYFTVRLNKYWKHSAYIVNHLINNLPPIDTKTVVLLNIPENMNGVAMIGARPDGQYKHMREFLLNTEIKNKMYDALSYNMLGDNDGAHVNVLNDSVVRVTLNQWGTWWWYDGHGAVSYENDDYKLNLKDPGHMYELTLKHPSSDYLLLFNIGNNWKTVDLSRKNEDQY